MARQVGWTFIKLGSSDPRLNAFGDLDVRLSSLVRQWKQADPKPSRVKPIPISVLHVAQHIATASGNPALLCVADMIWIAFYFLCRPGKCTAVTAESQPFWWCDTQLWLGHCRLNCARASEASLMGATCSALTFTLQKNCVPGEVVALGVSGSTTACGTRAIGRRILHLRRHGAAPDTPLCAFHDGNTWHVISERMVTNLLRQAAAIVGPSIGFNPADISTRSLRASGAMAMMCGGIDTTITRLRGRWHSDAMLRYLTVQAAPLVADAASRMLRGGNYRLVPGQDVQAVANILAQAEANDNAPLAPADPAPPEADPDHNAAATMADAAAQIAAANPPALAA